MATSAANAAAHAASRRLPAQLIDLPRLFGIRLLEPLRRFYSKTHRTIPGIGGTR